MSVDAIGSAQVAQSALQSLRPCGRHVQIGLDDAPGALAAMSTGSTPGVTVIRPGAGV
jgi:hypothetical protein